MSEIPRATATIPNPAELEQSNLLYEISLQEQGPQTLPLDGTVAELATESANGSEFVQLATLHLGAEASVNVWAKKSLNGQGLDQESVTLTPNNGQPLQTLLSETKAISISTADSQDKPYILGRNNQLAKDRLGLTSEEVSRAHLKVSLGKDGIRFEDNNSTNDTVVYAGIKDSTPIPEVEADISDNAGDTVLRNDPDVQAALAEAKRYAYTDPLEGVEKDEQFLEISAPFDTTMVEYTKTYTEYTAHFKKAEDYAKSINDVASVKEAIAKQAELDASYNRAMTTVRGRYEAALKPYLASRLKKLHGDKVAGFQHIDQLVADGRSVTTARGKRVSRRFEGMREFGQADQVLLGQITKPVRLNDWSAAAQSTKHDRYNNKNVTSIEHVVDLAAAMLAGTYDATNEESDPVILARDTRAEYDLPADLQGKLRLYKVVEGVHRVAAARLAYGLDASTTGYRFKGE